MVILGTIHECMVAEIPISGYCGVVGRDVILQQKQPLLCSLQLADF
jgi:hypothetical protein